MKLFGRPTPEDALNLRLDFDFRHRLQSVAVGGDHGFRYRRGTAIEQWLLFTEQRCVEKRSDESRDQTEVVYCYWGSGYPSCPWKRSGTSLKLG